MPFLSFFSILVTCCIILCNFICHDIKPVNTSLYFQGNFFQNIGSITLFAVIGTAISAFIVGGGIYFLGQVRIIVLTLALSRPVQINSLNFFYVFMCI